MADVLKPEGLSDENWTRLKDKISWPFITTVDGGLRLTSWVQLDAIINLAVAAAARAQGPGEAVAKKTMCLTLTDEEMAALEEVIKAKDATPKTIFRSALKLFQLEVRGFATVNVDLAPTPTREG